MNDLLKEAIADAKAVRETALANAKVALEEAFTPRLQSMLSAKLSEEDEMIDDDVEDLPEDMHNPDAPDSTSDAGDDLMAEPKDMPMGEMDDKESKVDEGEHDEKKVDEMDDKEPKMDEGDYEKQEEDLELEAIIKELEEDLDEELDSSDIGAGDNKLDADAAQSHTEDPGEGDLTETEDKEKEMKEEDEKKDNVDEDISLDEIISALREDEEKKDMKEDDEKKEDMKEEEDKEKDLKEAYDVIKFLKSKINEVNLLNAKLLFSNKLFRNYPLSENQKMKVIENFDRASNLREVKLIYSTLCESFTGSKTKRSIKESYASKPSKSTAPKKEILSEGNALAARWKKLANLK
jgi:hypothetical protein